MGSSQEELGSPMEALKGGWVTKRDGAVEIKGKGSMETYWLSDACAVESTSMVDSDDQSNSQRPFHSVEGNDTSEDRLNRLVDWNFESLLRLLRGVVARRMSNVGSSQEELDSPMEALKGV